MEQPESMPPSSNRVWLWGFSIGVGAVIAVALIIGGILWYQSRPEPQKPWNTIAVKASFDFLSTEGDKNTLCFYYTLENRTDIDYRLSSTDAESFAAKLERAGSLSVLNEDELKIDLPIFIPAKHKVRATVHLSYSCDEHQENYLDEQKEPDRARFQAAVGAWVKKKMPNLDGFVLFDKKNRYEIEFPKGW